MFPFCTKWMFERMFNLAELMGPRFPVWPQKVLKTSARIAITNNNSNTYKTINKYKSIYTVHTSKLLAQLFLKTNCTVIMKWLIYYNTIMNTHSHPQILHYILLWCLQSSLHV